jgi:hypothetical protein
LACYFTCSSHLAQCFYRYLNPGITGTVLDEVYPDRGGGLWEKEPERAIEVAALYFLIIGLAEITVLRPSSKQGGGNAPNE